jgi:hypothetical protein
MMTIVLFTLRLFFIRLCARQGAKRVIGGFDGAMYGLLFSWLGIFFVLSSRLLIPGEPKNILPEKYKNGEDNN